MPANDSPQCFSCSASEASAPLVSVRYAGRPAWICPACLPVLIHRTDELAAKLAQVARG